VKKYFQNKADNYERWLFLMQKVHQQYGEAMLLLPPISAAKL
jgi:hypothetical protein